MNSARITKVWRPIIILINQIINLNVIVLIVVVINNAELWIVINSYICYFFKICLYQNKWIHNSITHVLLVGINGR